MITPQKESLAQVRELALSAGRQHRAGIRRLEKHGAFRRGARRDLRKQMTALCRKAGVSRADAESALRIIHLVSPDGSTLSVSERAADVRRIYRELRRSSVHPMVLALASITDDSIAHAVRDIEATAGGKRAARVARRYALTVVGEDVAGFMLGYETGQKLAGTNASAYGIYLGISGAYHYSRWALDQGLPPF